MNLYLNWGNAYKERERLRGKGVYAVIRPLWFGLLWKLEQSKSTLVDFDINPKDALTLKKLKKSVKRQRKFYTT